jgi:hypothetical protein
MRSNTTRAAVVLATIGVAIVLFVVLSGDDGDDGSPTTPTRTVTTGKAPGRPAERAADRPAKTGPTKASEGTETITVAKAKPVGGIKRLEYTKGEQVRFVVRADVVDQVHVHGYDLAKPVAAGGSVRFSFPADIEGIFEIELERRKEQIAELRVKP